MAVLSSRKRFSRRMTPARIDAQTPIGQDAIFGFDNEDRTLSIHFPDDVLGGEARWHRLVLSKEETARLAEFLSQKVEG